VEKIGFVVTAKYQFTGLEECIIWLAESKRDITKDVEEL